MFRLLFIFFFLSLFNIVTADKVKDLKNKNPKIVSVEINLDFKGKNYKLVYTGAIVSDKGHVLIPFSYEKKSITDARLWYKQTEYSATVLDLNEQVDVALLKFEPDSKTEFFKILSQPVSPKTETLNITTSSNEENYFNQYKDTFQFLGYYFGQVDFFVIGSLNVNEFFLPGSVATDKDGNLVGILSDGRSRYILATYDINKHIKRMLQKSNSAGTKTNSEDKPYLGFTRNYVNKDFAESKNIPPNSIVVTAVFKNSPAEKSGLKQGDLITMVDKITLQGVNQNVERHFSKLLNPEIGETIEFQVIRDGKSINLSLTFQKKPEPKELKIDELGLSLCEIQQEDFYLDDIFTETGILITKIEPGSPAATSNEFGSSLLLKNDVILSINEKPIHTINDVSDAVNSAKNSNKSVILMHIMRGLSTKYVAMKIKNNEVKNEK